MLMLMTWLDQMSMGKIYISTLTLSRTSTENFKISAAQKNLQNVLTTTIINKTKWKISIWTIRMWMSGDGKVREWNGERVGRI